MVEQHRRERSILEASLQESTRAIESLRAEHASMRVEMASIRGEMSETDSRHSVKISKLSSSLSDSMEQKEMQQIEKVRGLQEQVMSIQEHGVELHATISERLLASDSTMATAMNQVAQRTMDAVEELRGEVGGKQRSMEKSIVELQVGTKGDNNATMAKLERLVDTSEKNEEEFSRSTEDLSQKLSREVGNIERRQESYRDETHQTMLRMQNSLNEESRLGLSSMVKAVERKIQDTSMEFETKVDQFKLHVESTMNHRHLETTERVTQGLNNTETRLDDSMEDRRKKIQEVMKEHLEIELSIRATALEGNLKTELNSQILRSMGEARNAMKEQVAIIEQNILTHVEKEGSEIRVAGLKSVKDHVLTQAMSAVAEKVDSVENSRNQYMDEMITKVEASLRSHLAKPCNELGISLSRLEEQVEHVKGEMLHLRENGDGASDVSQSAMRKVERIDERLSADHKEILEQFKDHEQRSFRKYDSCRQAIHVIATAINERAEQKAASILG